VPSSVRSARAVATAERRAQAVEMRRSRASFDEIGQALGVSRQRAWTIYQKALAEIPKPQAEQHLAEELQLIDAGIKDLWLLAHDHRRPRSAIDAWNGIARFIELEARLLDLFPAAKSRVQVITEEDVQREIEHLQAEIAAVGAERAHGGTTGRPLLALPPGQGDAVLHPA
jgi:hypothetical protein